MLEQTLAVQHWRAGCDRLSRFAHRHRREQRDAAPGPGLLRRREARQTRSGCRVEAVEVGAWREVADENLLARIGRIERGDENSRLRSVRIGRPGLFQRDRRVLQIRIERFDRHELARHRRGGLSCRADDRQRTGCRKRNEDGETMELARYVHRAMVPAPVKPHPAAVGTLFR
ncbi:MAG: hypothetical protein J0H86_23020 [Xanthomonadaceae bacterium]|nr:hypothetical protein [Xanthomonadaceae bacterium]